MQSAIGVFPSEAGKTAESKLKLPYASEYNISNRVGAANTADSLLLGATDTVKYCNNAITPLLLSLPI